MPVRCLLGVDQAVLDRCRFARRNESLAKALFHHGPVRAAIEVEKLDFHLRILPHFATPGRHDHGDPSVGSAWRYSNYETVNSCLLYTSPSPRDRTRSR